MPQYHQDDKTWRVPNWFLITFSVTFALVVIMVVAPLWNVWRAELGGRATLARAQSARKVLVAQAQAEREAATLRAQAIAIVGKAAQDYPQYRQQEFIGAFAEALQEGNIEQIVYIPTEANIPIIEPGRLAAQAVASK